MFSLLAEPPSSSNTTFVFPVEMRGRKLIYLCHCTVPRCSHTNQGCSRQAQPEDEGGKGPSTRTEGSPLPRLRTVPAQFSNNAQVQEERKRQRKVKLLDTGAAKPQEEEALVRGHHVQTPRAPQQTRGYRPACLCWS